MKKALLALQIILDNWLTHLILFVFAVLVAVLLHFTISESVKYGERLQLAHDFGFEQKLQETKLPSDFWIELPNFADSNNEVLQIPGVVTYYPATTFACRLYDESNGLEIYFDAVDKEYYEDLCYTLVKGSWPDSPNEAVLLADAMSHYAIGDRIAGPVDYLAPDGQATADSVEVKIVGFVDTTVAIFNFSIWEYTPGLDEVTTTLNQMATGAYSAENGALIGFCMTPTALSGEAINFEIIPKSPYLVTVDSDTDPQDIKPQLIEIFGGGRVHTGPEMIERYKVEHNEEYLQLIRYAFISLDMTKISLFAAEFLQHRKKRLEMTVYYICGTSWAQSLWFFTGSYYPLIATGALIGSAIYFKLSPHLIRTDPMTVAVILVFLLAVCSIQVLPSYFSARRIHPTEWIRKD